MSANLQFLLSPAETMSFESNVPLDSLQPNIRQFVEKHAKVCQPARIHICDGSEEENEVLCQGLIAKGTMQKLPKYENR